MRNKTGLLAIVGPGILVAATGVGAGDLATGAIVGSKLGVAVLWAVVVGAGLKFVLNEGLARWQLATGDTLLEGCREHFGRAALFLFLAYLLIWSYFVGSALMSACGVAAHAALPLFHPQKDKILYGVLHSAAAVALVKLGGYRLFEKAMNGCIAVMFVVVVTTALIVQPSWERVAAGLVLPTIPHSGGEGVVWTVALMGGVGGTVSVLFYGYWIREEGRRGPEDLRTCRIDLAVGYAMTALFGVAMVIVGSRLSVKGSGAELIVNLAEQLEVEVGSALGAAAKWMFLAGAWSAIFSSLLGVWQSTPYLFADFCGLVGAGKRVSGERAQLARSAPYQLYLFALASVPALGLWKSFVEVQKLYAVFGAMFIPMLAAVLLVLNGRTKYIGQQYRNSWATSLLLVAILAGTLLAIR